MKYSDVHQARWARVFPDLARPNIVVEMAAATILRTYSWFLCAGLVIGYYWGRAQPKELFWHCMWLCWAGGTLVWLWIIVIYTSVQLRLRLAAAGLW